MNIYFEGGGEILVISVERNNEKGTTQILFSNSTTGLKHFAPIEGLQLSKAGILKEHPDLMGGELADIRKIAIERLKTKLNTLKTDLDIREYVILELTKVGYKYKSYQKPGWRMQK